MDKIILYSTHCPKCEILEEKLKSKGIEYEEINDVDIMIKKNIMAVPVIEVNGQLLDFFEANKYINKL